MTPPPNPEEARTKRRDDAVAARVVRGTLTALLVLSLVCLLFFHVVSGTWAFNLGWNPRAEQGGEQQQFYLQGIHEPGTLLAGWRRESKMSDVPFPEFFWTLGKPLPGAVGGGPSSESSSSRQYTGGVFFESHDQPERHFRARYLYLRFWLLEVVVSLVLAGVWIPTLISRRAARRSSPR